MTSAAELSLSSEVTTRRGVLLASLLASTGAAAACACVAWTRESAPALPDGAASTALDLVPHAPLLGVAALVLVQFAFACRHFGHRVGVLTALLSAASPLMLGTARMATPDLLASAAQVAAGWLFFEVVHTRSRLSLASFVASFALALATKERSIVFIVPMLAFASWERFVERRDLSLGRVVLALAVPIGVGGLIWALAGGDAALGFGGVSNAYSRSFGRGAWYRCVIDLMLLSPWITALGLVAVLSEIWRRRVGERDSATLYLAFLAVLACAAESCGAICARDLVAVDAFLRALIVASAWRALRPGSTHVGAFAVVFALLLVSASEIASFRALFLEARIADPTTQLLLQARRLVPPSEPP